MALLYIDGFDHYSSTSDMSRTNRWSSVSGSTFNYQPQFSEGRVSGNCFAIGDGTLNSPVEAETLILGLAVKVSTTGGGAGSINFVFGNTSGFGDYDYVSVILTSSNGLITVKIKNGYDWITVASSSLGLIIPEVWNFLEIKVKISDSGAGMVIVRLNNVVVLSVTSVTTRQGGAGLPNTANRIKFGSAYSRIDDLYLLDGTTGTGSRPMNDFIGDKRVLTLSPASNVSTNFTPSGQITTEFATSTTGTWGHYPNRVYLGRFQQNFTDGGKPLNVRFSRLAYESERTQTLDALKIKATNAVAGIKIKPVIYSESATFPNTAGSLLAVGSETIGLAAGDNILPFGSPPTLVRGNRYYIGIIADTGFTLDTFFDGGGTLTEQWVTYDVAYTTGAPSVWPITGLGYEMNRVPRIELVMTPVPNYGAVNEAHSDNGLTYNYSSTVGAKDLFGTDGIVPTNAVVWGVQVSGSYSKDDAGARSMANVLKSGSTEVTGADLACSLAAYKYAHDIYTTDPNGGGDWTVSAVNAAKIGYKITV